MDIYSKPGTKVRYLSKRGYEYQKQAADLVFTKGQILTVKNIEVGSWSSSVEFEELPNKRFNTVMFENID